MEIHHPVVTILHSIVRVLHEFVRGVRPLMELCMHFVWNVSFNEGEFAALLAARRS
jgi:hypothetical protein